MMALIAHYAGRNSEQNSYSLITAACSPALSFLFFLGGGAGGGIEWLMQQKGSCFSKPKLQVLAAVR